MSAYLGKLFSGCVRVDVAKHFFSKRFGVSQSSHEVGRKAAEDLTMKEEMFSFVIYSRCTLLRFFADGQEAMIRAKLRGYRGYVGSQQTIRRLRIHAHL